MLCRGVQTPQTKFGGMSDRVTQTILMYLKYCICHAEVQKIAMYSKTLASVVTREYLKNVQLPTVLVIL